MTGALSEFISSDRPWLIHQVDVRDGLREIPDAAVQCVVTSPPYHGLRNYGVDGQLGLEPTVAEYVAKMVEVFAEVRRVLRPDGTLWLNLGDSYMGSGRGPQGQGGSIIESYWTDDEHREGLPLRGVTTDGLKQKDLVGIPWRVAFALQADGWYLRQDIIWAKPNPMPESVQDRCTKAHEYLFLLSKSPRYFYDAEAVREEVSGNAHSPGSGYDRSVKASPFDARDEQPAFTRLDPTGRNRRSVWNIPTEPYPEAHFATYPTALVEPCIKAGTSERGRCPSCSSPWRRVVERKFQAQTDVSAERGIKGAPGQKPMDASNGWEGFPRGTTNTETTGWEPSCACDAGNPVPCLVLDPFSGSGTTVMTALRLNRRGLGLELSPVYCELARRRVYNDSPMFNGVLA